jgi:mRNA interferase RelE/StbE
MPEYRLVYSETAKNQISNLHPEIKSIIRSRLNIIQEKPFTGQRLERELSGYRSLRAKRFRIIYKFNEAAKIFRGIYLFFRKKSDRCPMV